MAKRKRQRHCFAPGCQTGYKWTKGRQPSLFSVPKDEEKRKLWERNLHRQDKSLDETCAVCELHFEPSCIIKDYVHVVNGEEVRIPRGKPELTPDAVPTAPCLHHSYGQLVDQLSCVTPMMLPCTCSKELNGNNTSQHVDSKVLTTTTKTEPEESAASDEEFFEMPLAVEMETGEGPCNLPVSIKEEPLDIPAVPTEDTGEADEILGVTGIETLVVAAQCRAKGEAENGSRASEEEACSP